MRWVDFVHLSTEALELAGMRKTSGFCGIPNNVGIEVTILCSFSEVLLVELQASSLDNSHGSHISSSNFVEAILLVEQICHIA